MLSPYQRRAILDDSDEEEAAAAEQPRGKGPLVSESPVPETPHAAAIDLTEDPTPENQTPAPRAPSPVPIELSDSGAPWSCSASHGMSRKRCMCTRQACDRILAINACKT